MLPNSEPVALLFSINPDVSVVFICRIRVSVSVRMHAWPQSDGIRWTRMGSEPVALLAFNVVAVAACVFVSIVGLSHGRFNSHYHMINCCVHLGWLMTPAQRALFHLV